MTRKGYVCDLVERTKINDYVNLEIWITREEALFLLILSIKINKSTYQEFTLYEPTLDPSKVFNYYELLLRYYNLET